VPLLVPLLVKAQRSSWAVAAEAAAMDALNEEAVDNYVGAVTSRDRAKHESEAVGENVLPVRARVNITAILNNGHS
jgi:hypothetical protein